MGMFYNNYRDEMKKLIMVVFAAAAFVNGLLGFVTLGIYTPREARVYCAK